MGETYVKSGFLFVVYFIFSLQALLPVLQPEVVSGPLLWLSFQGILLIFLISFSVIFWIKTGNRDNNENYLSQNDLPKKQLVTSAGATVGMVVHELRKPLSRLRLRFQEQADQDEISEIPAELNEITGTIKKVEKIFQTRQFKPRWQPFPRFLAELYSEFDHEFEVITRSDLSWVQVDRQQLKIALRNLVENSAEAYERNDRDGEIILNCFKLGPEVCISVKDKARGIEPELARVINGESAPGKNHGMGLGLLLVKKICKNHGGRLMIESEEDVGTEVTITLPWQVGN